MQIISKKISLIELSQYNNENIIERVSVNKNINPCDNNILIEQQSVNNKFITYKNIFIPFQLTRQFKDIGYYDALDENIELSLNIPDNYFITGESESRLDEFRTYSGQLIENINISDDENIFSAVLSITNTKITYVIGGRLVSGVYLQNSGIIYEEYGGKTYIKYYPYLFDKKYDKYIFKNNSNIGMMKPIKIENRLFINRGSASPLGNYYYMRMVNKLDDAVEIPIKII